MSLIKKKFVIISGYFDNESYGLLGPQMAATIIQEKTDYECIVIALSNNFNKANLKKALSKYFGTTQNENVIPIVGFSTLGGRLDLFEFAKELKSEGTITILAGPQAGVDYIGEQEKDIFPHRFQGFTDNFNFAIQGPAEQITPFLKADIDTIDFESLDFNYPGFIYRNNLGKIINNPPAPFISKNLSKVSWDNIFILKNSSLKPLKISSAQILQQIGCPYASVSKKINIDYPEVLSNKGDFVKIDQKGCSFCDVAADKGFIGNLSEKTILEQLELLPETEDLKKIPFELINETPVTKLKVLLHLAKSNNIKLSQINLTLRADNLISNIEKFKDCLITATKNKVQILISSIGFESFDNTILKNLNKGVTAQENIEVIKKIRSLAYEFKGVFYYMRKDGANHGFIHPTPWDNDKVKQNTDVVVNRYNLAQDILPNHSTPLIIHHASSLGDWARQIEIKHGIKFARHGSTIGWWQIDGNIVI